MSSDLNVAAGQVWRHWKGHTYFIVAVGEMAVGSLEPVVVYRRTDGNRVWVLPLTNFLAELEPGTKHLVRVR